MRALFLCCFFVALGGCAKDPYFEKQSQKNPDWVHVKTPAELGHVRKPN